MSCSRRRSCWESEDLGGFLGIIVESETCGKEEEANDKLFVQGLRVSLRALNDMEICGTIELEELFTGESISLSVFFLLRTYF